jgi:hypothetical protein
VCVNEVQANSIYKMDGWDKHPHVTQRSIIIIRFTRYLDLQWKLLTKMEHTEQSTQEDTFHNDVAYITVNT